MKQLMIALAVIAALSLTGCPTEPPPAETFTLTYSLNGGTGTLPTAVEDEVGTAVTLAAGTGISKTEFAFAGWNTAADGSGTSYAGGATFTIGAADVTLYATWTDLIVGTWTADADAAGQMVNLLDLTTITASTFSTTRTLRWTAAAAFATSNAVTANQTVTVEMATAVLVPAAYPNQATLLQVLGLLGITATTGNCSNVLVSGTYTRVMGSAQFALTDNTKNNTPAITAAAATAGTSEVIGNPAINPYTGYFTRSMTFSTLGDTAGSPAAPVSTSNPKPQNWMTHFTADMNTMTLWDGGSIMPVSRVAP